MTVLKQQKSSFFGTKCLPSKCYIELTCVLNFTIAWSDLNNIFCYCCEIRRCTESISSRASTSRLVSRQERRWNCYCSPFNDQSNSDWCWQLYTVRVISSKVGQSIFFLSRRLHIQAWFTGEDVRVLQRTVRLTWSSSRAWRQVCSMSWSQLSWSNHSSVTWWPTHRSYYQVRFNTAR